MTWVDAGAIAEMKFQPGHPVELQGRWIAVFRHDDRYFATDNACPHASAPLCDGTILDGKIVCALHLWEFDLETGACDVGPDWGVQTYPTRVVGDRIEVDLPEPPR